ncbi:MAG TPA: 30S ribosomal protein S6 [Gemmata sp.]|nr:30S ribosomal protein S6 [Gemmata sp.]
MPAVTYETMFLLDPNKVSTDADGTKQQLHHVLERHGATILVSRPWDYNHKLSYSINKQKKGAFHIIYYSMESTRQRELERDFALQEGLILRQLTLKVDPKWEDIILGIAREEQGTGFAVRGMRDEATVTTDASAIGAEPGVPHGMVEENGAQPPREGGAPRRSRRAETAEKLE